MAQKNSKLNLILQAVSLVGILVLVGFVFYMQSQYKFVLEDMDYMKNFATGEKLQSLSDVFKSIPGIMRKGGSSLSLFVLQLILLAGEKAADFINMAAILIVVFLLSRCSGAKRTNVFFIALPFFFMFSLNADWKYSYLWEFGIVNYVFPAIPFLIFLYMVIYEIAIGEKPEGNLGLRALLGCCCAFAASWANGSYGLVVLFTCIFSIILFEAVLGIRARGWIFVAAGFSVAGLFLYLLNSGNFGKNSVMSSSYLDFSIFPAVVLALLMLAVLLRSGGWLNAVHLLIIGVMCFCVAARFILQFIPGVATNGMQVLAMLVSIVLFSNLLRSFMGEHKKAVIWGYLISLCAFLFIILTMLGEIGGIS